jgi:hypothetical protein
MPDRVIIVGTNPNTRNLVDWSKDADYWVFNEVAGHAERGKPIPVRDGNTGEITSPPYWCKKVTGSIQIHAPIFWRSLSNLNDPDHYKWLQEHRGHPIWMQEHYEDVPESVRYPRPEIVEMFSNFHRDNGEPIDYFTSSPADMVALAVYKGYKVIELYGIEMGSDTEYFRQQPGMNYWVGVAVGRGIEVILPAASQWLRDLPYGYTGEIMIMRSEIEMRMANQEIELKKLEVDVFEKQGKMQGVFNALAQTKSQSDATRLQKEYETAKQEAMDASFKYGIMAGKFMENKFYMTEIDEKINAAGGEKAVQTFLKSGEGNPA